MFYSGSNGLDPVTTVPYAHGIGHASSTDGINWVRDADNPIFIYSNGITWRDSRTYTPFVLFSPFCDLGSCATCFLKMWFTGGRGTVAGTDQGIGYATLPCPPLPPLPPPVITNVNPNFGPTAGGNTVVITGVNFTGTTAVFFGSNPAISFVVNSDSSITAVAPPGAAGTVDITVVTTHGTSSITVDDHYTYNPPPPPPPPTPPLPPSHFVGIIKENKFLNKTNYILEAKWDPSPSPDVVSYRIYKHKKVVEEISAESSLLFETCLHSKHFAKAYSVTAVNSFNLESTHVKIKVIHE